MSRNDTTVTVTDPNHEFFGRVGFVLNMNENYTQVRIIYTDGVIHLTNDQYRLNRGVNSGS